MDLEGKILTYSVLRDDNDDVRVDDDHAPGERPEE
jgi:hypothetical protein